MLSLSVQDIILDSTPESFAKAWGIKVELKLAEPN